MPTQRTKPADIRAVAELSETMKRAGILYVPMPALNKEDYNFLLLESIRRLELIEKEQK
ncbi:DUF1382 family protein [Candidatus Babeliales bacterium]|nr:DUF1382 family protein [Candidatus Babeliales bacterium]